ncbi:MAG: acyl transferase [Bacteroidota bacterium]
MQSFKSFQQRLFQINDATFNDFAWELFLYQVNNNPIYKSFITHLGIDIRSIKNVGEIPFLPISFFKYHEVMTERWEVEATYESSGTTDASVSRHYVRNTKLYLKNTSFIFNHFYGKIEDYHMLFLLPSYIERGSSSLVSMADYFIKRSGSKYSNFYLNNFEELITTVESIRRDAGSKKILLCGVSFALLELAEKFAPDLHDVVIMETGGMKGRRKEITRKELHNYLIDRFNVLKIHSEYGMTELSSQAYSQGNAKFKTPPWMKILIRDTNDPLDIGNKRSGGINVIDLANISSCAFIETQDLGTVDSNGEFEVLGRFDNSDIRGCNLMV